MIAADPEYGRIVCHCERVTRGEIRDALAGTVPPGSLDGLRRHARPGRPLPGLPLRGGRPRAVRGGQPVNRTADAPGDAPFGIPFDAPADGSGDPSGEALVDVLVVGGGPAGLALAARLAAAGAGRIEVLEREQDAGGMPRHLHHGGFGRPPRPWLRGPEYAARSVRAAVAAGVAVRTGVTATGWAGPLSLETTSPAGLERITARAVVLATGARERPRSARLVPGSRPQGVLTTGELFQSVHRYGLPVGRRAVVVGAEPVARHAVGALRRAGADVVAMVTERPRGTAVPGVPLLAETTVGELLGRGRLTGVAVRHRDGRSGILACDTVVFTGDWIPDHELARRGGIALDPGTRGPRVDASFRTSAPGVFAVGNALHGIERAATAAGEGAAAAAPVLAHLAGAPGPSPARRWRSGRRSCG